MTPWPLANWSRGLGMSGSRWCKASPSLSGEVTGTTWVLPGGPVAVSEEGTGLFSYYILFWYCLVSINHMCILFFWYIFQVLKMPLPYTFSIFTPEEHVSLSPFLGEEQPQYLSSHPDCALSPAPTCESHCPWLTFMTPWCTWVLHAPCRWHTLSWNLFFLLSA